MIDLNTIRGQAALDIRGWMPSDQFDKFYPELTEEKKIFSQYQADVSNWMPQEQDAKFYPEIFQWKIEELTKVEAEPTEIIEPAIQTWIKTAAQFATWPWAALLSQIPWVWEFWPWFVSKSPEVIWNILGFVSWLVDEETWAKIKEAWTLVKQKLQEQLEIKEWPLTALWEIAAETAPAVAIPWAAPALAAKAPFIAWAAQAALWTQAAAISARWELATPVETAIGWLAWWLLGKWLASAWKVFGNLQKKFAWIDEWLESVINPTTWLSAAEQAKFIKSWITQPQRAIKLDNFLKQADANALNPREISALGSVKANVKEAQSIIAKQVRDAWKKVWEIKKAIWNKLVPKSKTNNIVNKFNKLIKERFNAKITTKWEIKAIPGREIKLWDVDKKRLLEISNEINKLTKWKVTINKVDDIKAIIDDKIDFEKAILKKDKLEKTIEQIRWNINAEQRAVSPELWKVNEEFSKVVTLQKKIFKTAWWEAEKSETILKRVLSERDVALKELFDDIAERTWIDLFEDAVFAKFATETLWSDEAVWVLRQMIERARTAWALWLIERAWEAAARVVAKPEVVARWIARQLPWAIPTTWIWWIVWWVTAELSE